MNSWTLSDEILAGQRLMVGFDGTGLDADLRYLIQTVHVGGIILFSKNIRSPEQIKELCADAQHFAKSCRQPPLFIAVDQEGGEVARLKAPFSIFPGNCAMKNEMDAIRFAEITASELKDVGLNMNMAPVLDVIPVGMTGLMTKRSFGSDPQRVSKMGALIIDHFQKNRIMAVAKHFPGIGRAVADPHKEISSLNMEPEEMDQTDLFPFRTAVSHSVAGVMLSHLLYRKADPDWPASLSVAIAYDLLQSKMKYKGIVLTDDLDMGAIEKHFDLDLIVDRLIDAEIDIALICHRSGKIERAFEGFLTRLGRSAEIRQKGISSVRKILNLKAGFLENGVGTAAS
ncbi:MAG: beta-N-acetylhexosaminidase [Deltaproteobacteria bacterium RBG_13_49_15]|nr:MAG: beta-N-acetylhexosaminidase [Deltaproteobacteria bacterium RBG_13_49_15]